MKQSGVRTLGVVGLLLAAVMVLLAGCGQPVMAEPAGDVTSYRGALSTAYEGALDAVGQLALGTLRLEDTAQAVTEGQAAVLLPMWRVLQGGELQGDAERDAVLAQVEAAMNEEQVSDIAAMQLTQADVQAWAQGEDLAAGTPVSGGSPVQASVSEDQLAKAHEGANMSDEDRAAQRAQLGGSATAGPGGGGSQGLLSAVVDLLAAQSETAVDAVAHSDAEVLPPSEPLVKQPSIGDAASPEAVVAEPMVAEPEPVVAELEPVVAEPAAGTATGGDVGALPAQVETASEARYVVRAGNTLAAIAQAYGVTVETIVQANDIQDPNTIHVGQELTIPDPALVPGSVAVPVPSAVEVQVAETGSTGESTAASVPALEWLADDDPGPPLTIEVSANTATQDPLVERSQTYVVTGIVRNDGDQTYAVSDILVTFYDADGFRGTFTPAIRDGELVGGEWHWHGETEAEFAALLLAPGEEWPFSVAITAQDMASFLIHPDASATERQSLPVELSDVKVTTDSTGYLRIAGTATNVNDVAVKNVTVSAVLLDANGQIVSLGSTYVLQEDIEPGASVSFDLRVTKEPYVSYQLYAQAERDWE